MILFYIPTLQGTEQCVILDKNESKHAIKVLRLKRNDIIHLTNGKGTLCTAIITNYNTKYCEVQITKTIKEYQKRNYYLHIAIAPTKMNERFEWFLEKCTEIGIDEITPIICKNSERKIIKKERLKKVILSAAKQSLNTYIPKLNDAIFFDKFISNQPKDYKKYIAHCQDTNHKKNIKKVLVRETKSIILIGPEGDFSIDEIQISENRDFIPISLGKSRLRTETAGITVCHSVNFINS